MKPEPPLNPPEPNPRISRLIDEIDESIEDTTKKLQAVVEAFRAKDHRKAAAAALVLKHESQNLEYLLFLLTDDEPSVQS